MRAALMTREYPPNVYGGAGVHVEYLSRELAKKIEVEVHCWGDQDSDNGNLHVRGAQPWSKFTRGMCSWGGEESAADSCRSGSDSSRWPRFWQSTRWTETPFPRVTKPVI